MPKPLVLPSGVRVWHPSRAVKAEQIRPGVHAVGVLEVGEEVGFIGPLISLVSNGVQQIQKAVQAKKARRLSPPRPGQFVKKQIETSLPSVKTAGCTCQSKKGRRRVRRVRR